MWRPNRSAGVQPSALGPLAPLGQEAASVLNALPPAIDFDQRRGPQLQKREHLPIPRRLRQLNNLDLGGRRLEVLKVLKPRAEGGIGIAIKFGR